MPVKQNIIKVKKFELPIYTENVIFVYSDCYKLVYEFAKSEGFKDENLDELNKPSYSGMHMELEEDDDTGRIYRYIFVIKSKDKYNNIDTISHEITHAVAEILGGIGIKFNKKNEEAYAYLIGYLNKEFHKFIDGK